MPPDAIQNWIAELQSEKYSAAKENLRSAVDTAVAALQEIETGLSPVIGPEPSNTFLAGPTSGPASDPTFRLIVAPDINGLSPTFAQVFAGPGNATTPAFSSSTDETGFYFQSNQINLTVAGVQHMLWTASQMLTVNASGFGINYGTGIGGPNIMPDHGSNGAGLGASVAGNATLYAGSSVNVLDASATLLTASQTLNFASGKGVQFNGSAVLSDYETGSWTPVDASGASLSLTVTSATYVKIGSLVLVQTRLAYPATADGTNASIGGLPFTSAQDSSSGIRINGTGGNVAEVSAAQTAFQLFGAAQLTNAILSNASLFIGLTYHI